MTHLSTDLDATTALRRVDLPPGAPLKARAKTERATSVARALAAFSILVVRYTGDESPKVRVGRVDRDGETHAVAEVTLAVHPEMSIAAALERSVAAIEDEHFDCRHIVPGEHLTLDCTPATASAQAAGVQPRMFLTVRGGDSVLLSGVSHVTGLLSAPVPAKTAGVHWRRVMDALIGDPLRSIAQIPLLSDAEVELLDLWSRSESIPEIVDGALLHELFERHAARQPGRIALDCRGELLSYGALNARANQLARYLRARGVRVGSHVAFQLPRGADVYVVLLAVLKTGAAYVPLDPVYPPERVRHVLVDASVHTLITTASGATALGPLGCETFRVDADWHRVARYPTCDSTRAATQATARDVCYVIYTSGSTGRPKGVAVEHESACHLVRAEAHLFRVDPEDRVFQGFSIAFDAAVEETWLAFFAGATLVVGTEEMLACGAGLARVLTDAKITVFSCVPTLLSMLEEDLPTVRLLILGGEACPQDLVERFSRPGRRMVNTYGPTEATVIATYGDLHPGAPLTIGRPIPNTSVYILDRSGAQTPPGAPGEIYLGGVALARGYVGQPDMTAARFVDNPLYGSSIDRLYRTGDLGRFNAAGEIEFLGRADAQVKVRGFRVELSEIESSLMAFPAVQTAVVSLREDVPGVSSLVGYVILHPGKGAREDELKAYLRRTLPPYMVPGRIQAVAAFPTLPSGKVDRKSLPPPSAVAEARAGEPPHGGAEEAVADAWARALGLSGILRDDDFFADLGGHSLAAARATSSLRRDARFAALSVLDLYGNPTVRKLAALAGRGADEKERDKRLTGSARERDAEDEDVSGVIDLRARRRHFACGVAQAAALYFVAALYALEWVSPYLAFAWQTHVAAAGVLEAALFAFAAAVAAPVVLLVLAIATKWIVIGRYVEGRYPLWGSYYVRHWLAETIGAMAPTALLAGTPLMALYARAMGATVGANVHIGTTGIGGFDLLTFGDGATLQAESSLEAVRVEEGALVVSRIELGARSSVGTRSVVEGGASLRADARVGDLSMVPSGMVLPAREGWSGSPVRRDEALDAVPEAPRPPATIRARLAYAALALLLPTFLPLAFLPGFALLGRVEQRVGALRAMLALPLVSLLFLGTVCGGIVALKWLLLGRVRAGTYRLHGHFYIRKWLFDQLMTLSLSAVGSLYATLYLNPWYRALGVKLGRGAEISTAPAFAPDLLEIGEDAFVADCASLGASQISSSSLTLAPVRVGKRAFVGNSAVVPPAGVVADDALLGVLSRAPASAAEQARVGASWLGSPPISLPQRQASRAFAEEATYRPSRALVLQRLAIEAVRVLLPSTCFIALTSVLITSVLALAAHVSGLALASLVPLLYLALGVGAGLLVVVLKWVLVGRYAPAEKPLWSSFVWRTELVTAMQENLADAFLTGLLKGTPFLPWFFRALGVKVGRRVHFATTEITEYDLVEIGSDVSLGRDCTLQTHLFEDRVMKMSHVRIGARCSVGADAVVLYDARMETGSSLGALSLLMKGESLPRGTRWEGTPARAVPVRSAPSASRAAPPPRERAKLAR